MSDNDNSNAVSVTEDVQNVTGENDVPTENLLSDDNDVVEWQFDERALFETVSRKIYSSDSAAIRELTTNHISAVVRGERLYDITNGRVAIHIFADENQDLTLVIRDNGEGITEDLLKNGLAYVGRSPNRWVPDVMGKFGVGFLAAFMLVPDDGAFVMHTKPRKDGEHSYKGVWSARGFELDATGTLDDVFDEDEYGTRLEFPLKDDITLNNLRNWVEKYARYSRVPVEYCEHGVEKHLNDHDDKNHWGYLTDQQEVHGGSQFSDDYDDTEQVYTIETDEFVAHAAPSARNRAVLLDTVIDRYYIPNSSSPLPIDIRLLNENGVIVDGPNKGLNPVRDSEYEAIPEEMQDGFIRESEMSGDDIQMPHPTGNRENLTESSDFWDWLGRQFAEQILSPVASVFEHVDSVSDLSALSDDDLEVVLSAVEFLPRRLEEDESFTDLIHDKHGIELGIDVPDDVVSFLTGLKTTGRQCHKDGSRTSTPLATLAANSLDTEGRVFMAMNVHDGKARVALEDDSSNRVVRLPKTTHSERYDNADEMYAEFEEVFGWERLKNITSSNVDEFDVSEETKEAIGARKSNAGAKERKLTLHFEDEKTTQPAGDIATVLNLDEDEDLDDFSVPFRLRNLNDLVLFPDSEDASVSSHYALATNKRAVARCTKNVADYLSEAADATLYSELQEEMESTELITADGEYTLSELPDDVVFHIVTETAYNVFVNERDTLQAIQGHLATRERWGGDLYFPDGLTYVPVTESRFKDAISTVDDYDVIVDRNVRYDYPGNDDISLSVWDTQLYAHVSLPEWQDAEGFEMVISNLPSMSRGGKAVVDALVQSHDAGAELDLQGLVTDA